MQCHNLKLKQIHKNGRTVAEAQVYLYGGPLPAACCFVSSGLRHAPPFVRYFFPSFSPSSAIYLFTRSSIRPRFGLESKCRHVSNAARGAFPPSGPRPKVHVSRPGSRSACARCQIRFDKLYSKFWNEFVSAFVYFRNGGNYCFVFVSKVVSEPASFSFFGCIYKYDFNIFCFALDKIRFYSVWCVNLYICEVFLLVVFFRVLGVVL